MQVSRRKLNSLYKTNMIYVKRSYRPYSYDNNAVSRSTESRLVDRNFTFVPVHVKFDVRIELIDLKNADKFYARLRNLAAQL